MSRISPAPPDRLAELVGVQNRWNDTLATKLEAHPSSSPANT